MPSSSTLPPDLGECQGAFEIEPCRVCDGAVPACSQPDDAVPPQGVLFLQQRLLGDKQGGRAPGRRCRSR